METSPKTILNTTLLFLIKRNPSTQEVDSICLAMKKRGFGMNRWNGVGGKVKPPETVEQAALREAQEEISVVPQEMHKVALLNFSFPHNPQWNQTVHVYFCERWLGEPTESGEMRPQWYTISTIPFANMWPDDIFWLPKVLAGEKVTGSFTFGEADVILEKNISPVRSL